MENQKKIIRLTEEDIVHMIKESIQNILQNTILNEAFHRLDDFFIVEKMLPYPVHPNLNWRTHHFQRDRGARRKEMSQHNQKIGTPMYSFIVDTGNHLGSEIHTITDRAILIIQGVNDKRIITYYPARPNQITRYWQKLNIPTPTDAIFSYIIKFAKLNVKRYINLANTFQIKKS